MGTTERPSPDAWGDVTVAPGEHKAVPIPLTETYSGSNVETLAYVWRGEREGPTVSVTAAVHGDELNGTGAIRRLIMEEQFELRAGTLVLVPVVNIVGFERHSRYLPDRRDLNRSFPGSSEGSLSSRMALSFFKRVTRRCDYGIDLHTAAVRRTNFPNVRADMADPKLAPFARAFGAELIVNGAGPKGSLRRSACRAGCPTLILEAGEVWKIEPTVVEYALQGIRNCLVYLGMVEGPPTEPPYRIETDTTKWVRATNGGFLHFHVSPGDIVKRGDALATVTSLLGEEQGTVVAPREGVILGMTTLPAVSPGDVIAHIAFSKRGALRRMERALDRMEDESIYGRVREDLATSMTVTESSSESGEHAHD